MVGVQWAGCETASQKLAEGENAKVVIAQLDLKSAREQYLEEWRRFHLETEQEIDLNQKKIDLIKEIMIDVGPKAIKNYKIELGTLHRINRELQIAMDEYTYDGRIEKKDDLNRVVMN